MPPGSNCCAMRIASTDGMHFDPAGSKQISRVMEH